MPKIIINPGTDALAGANEDLAVGNMQQLVLDLPFANIILERAPDLDNGEGRYGFFVQYKSVEVGVLMPGLPLERVRYMGAPEQNIWHYPRLYVDGSSWVWKFALNIISDRFHAIEKE